MAISNEMFYKLINENESEYLDYKEIYHVNKACLIHDILCLANADTNNDRYLIFGIDDDKKICGIESDKNRKKMNEIYDVLATSHLSDLPSLSLTTFAKESHEIDVLKIINKPKKPYTLLKDKTDHVVTIRNGVIYSRYACRNTAKDSAAPPESIEHMYRERFGLDKTPFQRIQIYLKDIDGWEKSYKYDRAECYFYKQHPEFTLVKSPHSADSQDFEQAWTKTMSDPKASRTVHFLMYHETVLKIIYVVYADGCRYQKVQPEDYNNFDHLNSDFQKNIIHSFYYIKDSVNYLCDKLINHFYPYNCTYSKDFACFDSKDEAEQELAQFINAKTNYSFYETVLGSQKHKIYSSDYL